MTQRTTPLVPASWGELLDKISILEIKLRRMDRPEALANVQREHRLLSAIGDAVLRQGEVAELMDALRAVNEALWDIEDAIRMEEANGRFGPDFIRLARSVYKRNDERADLKRRINAVLGSELVEEKKYADHAASRPIASSR